MEISEQFKRYIFIYSCLGMIILLIYVAGKQKKFSCDEWANNFKEKFHCNIILIDKSNSGGLTTLTGMDLETQTVVDCGDDSKWIREHFDSFNKGDTIIKKEGEYTILIKRKNKKILIPLVCNKVYKD